MRGTTTITCPRCGHREAVETPTDRCQLVHDCRGCGATLHRAKGSCCVYCAPPLTGAPPARPRGQCC